MFLLDDSVRVEPLASANCATTDRVRMMAVFYEGEQIMRFGKVQDTRAGGSCIQTEGPGNRMFEATLYQHARVLLIRTPEEHP